MSKSEHHPDLAGARAAQLEPYQAFLYGNRFASLVAIKGEPGPAERAGKPPFFGSDAEALERALATIGIGSNAWCGIGQALDGTSRISAGELRVLIEIIDPTRILALDRSAIEQLKEGYGADLMPCIPKPGSKTRLLGRLLVFVDGFEAALTSEDDEAKHRVWRELKALKD